MKNIKNIGNSLTRVTLLAAVAGLALLSYSAVAQEKGAEHLIKPQPLNTPADVRNVPAGATAVMACPKCKDTSVTVVENTGKAANPYETKTVLRHECPGCNTKIVTEGVGKQAQNKVVHTCANGGPAAASCCATK